MYLTMFIHRNYILTHFGRTHCIYAIDALINTVNLPCGMDPFQQGNYKVPEKFCNRLASKMLYGG